MKKNYLLVLLLLCSINLCIAQAVPEMMYYKFDVAGTTVANDASSPVGTNPAPLTGLTIGGTGQFGTGLVGTAGTTSTNNVNTGWPVSLSGSWTISMWISIPATAPTTRYYFGDGTSGTAIRCFTGGVAGTTGLRLTGTGFTLDMTNIQPTPVVVHYVYDATANTLSSYLNGVFNTSISVSGLTISSANNFYVGASSATSLDGTMDEFRMYNRALTASEISTTWNITLPGGPCTTPPTAGLATASDSTPCSGIAVGLGLSGNSYGTGQTYEWESAPSASGPWTSLGAPAPTTGISTTPPSGTTTYYHCLVTCGASTVASGAVPVTASVPFPAGIYTINASQPQSSTNFPSFAAALSAVSCGISGAIVFNVDSASGPYNEQIELPSTIGTNATNTITFNGNGAILTKTLTATGTNYATLNLDGADYITFNNLTIEAMGASYGFAVHLMNNADNNSFNNCTIRANLAATASTSGCVSMSGSRIVYSTAGGNGSNNTFNGCTLSGGYFGFAFYGNAPANNMNNTITNCAVREYYLYGSQNIQQGSGVISNNIFERPTRTPVSTGYGVSLSTGCTNMLVEKNKVKKLWDALPTATGTTYGIYCSATTTAGNENKIFNNLVSDINFNGTIYGVYTTGATNIQVYNNTISLDQTSATGTTTTYGIYASGTSGVDIKNNNISISRGGTGAKYCLYFVGVGKTSDYNNLYMASTTGTIGIGYYSAAFTTLAAWQGANSNAWDQNSQNLNPIFANAGSGDYTPANSLLDDKGTPLAAITTDITGATRNATTPDIGAYEFTVPVCSGQPTAGTATINTTSACLGGLVSMSLSGFTVGTGISIQWDSAAAGTGIWYPIAGATSTSYNTTFSVPTDFQANVTCANGGQTSVSNTVSVAQNPFYSCYCSPNTGVTLHTSTANYITNVSIPTTTLNASTTVVGAGGYTQQNPSTASNTASVVQGQSYTFNASVSSASWRAELWIDWDQNGTYDASEYTLLPAATLATTNVVVPLTATPGMTGMRIRVCASTTTLFGATGACSNISVGRETEDYVITVVATTACAGQPTAGVAAVNTTTACVGGSLNLSLTGYTIGTGITIQWDSAAAGTGIWYPIAGATSTTYNTTFSVPTDFQANVTCANGGQTSTSNTVSVAQNPFYSCYCSPNTGVTLHTSTANYITNVAIPSTTLNSPTTLVGTGGYTQHTPSVAANTASIVQGQSYPLNVSVSSASWRAELWIDWDQNGTYDASEYTLLPAATLATTNIVVPFTATPGMTGMRLRVCASTSTLFGATGACSNISVGRETEDFAITIVAATPCSGTPSSAGIAAINKTMICNQDSLMLSLTNYPPTTGLGFQWQSSPAGQNNFVDISGATTLNYTVYGVSASTDYRMATTCLNTSGTAYSDTVSVTVSSPQMASTLPGSRCGTGPVTLAAQAANGGFVNWYDVPTGGVPLATSINVFTTPSISTTTNYYAAPSSGGYSGVLGLPDRVGSTTNSGYSNIGLVFDATSAFTINSVAMYPVGSGGTVAVNIALQNASGTTLQSTTANLTTSASPGTKTVVPLNFNVVAPGTNYRLVMTSASGGGITGFIREVTTGFTYPYTFPGVASITSAYSGGVTSSYYYYFYDWQISTGCEGARVPVTATINGAASGNSLSTGGTTVGNNQTDGTTVDYNDACNDKVATITDASGGNILGATSATVVTQPTVQTFMNAPYVPRVFDISPASNGAATVTLYVLQSEFTMYNNYLTSTSSTLPMLPTNAADVAGMANIVITQFHGSPADSNTGPGGIYKLSNKEFIPNSSITSSSNGTYWTLTFPVTGFSGFFIHTGIGPLTIKLGKITATNVGSRNRVDWNTLSEEATDKFIIERSVDGRNYTELATKAAIGKPSTYSYWDQNPVAGMNYYRLKMIDAAGKFAYSNIATATVAANGSFVVEAFPNPVSNQLTVKTYGAKGNNATITITDVTGKVVLVQEVSSALTTVNMNGISSGIYLMKYTDTEHTQTVKITKQ